MLCFFFMKKTQRVINALNNIIIYTTIHWLISKYGRVFDCVDLGHLCTYQVFIFLITVLLLSFYGFSIFFKHTLHGTLISQIIFVIDSIKMRDSHWTHVFHFHYFRSLHHQKSHFDSKFVNYWLQANLLSKSIENSGKKIKKK